MNMGKGEACLNPRFVGKKSNLIFKMSTVLHCNNSCGRLFTEFTDASMLPQTMLA